MAKPLLEIAYDYISSLETPTSFNDLWDHICTEAGLSSEEAANKVARFYTNLMLDGRFVFLGDNLWDLRTRQTFAKVHIDMKDAYSDEVVSESNEDENEENYDNDLTETEDDNSENED